MENKIIEFPKNKKKELERKWEIDLIYRLLDEHIQGDYHLVIDGDKNQHLFDKDIEGSKVVFTSNYSEYKEVKDKNTFYFPLKD